jgi:nitrite reductase/ring-hydroxylating ferredoxin subunit
MFFFALLHGGFSILQFHAFGDLNPLVSVLVSNTHYGSVMRFPFQSLGLLALIVLLLMAVTSHDFWLHNLSPRVWKGLHMLVYIAYVLIVLHVMLGVVQLENSPWLVGALALGLVTLISLHLITGFQSYRRDQSADVVMEKDFVKVCAINEIRENKARLAVVGDRSIAIFRYNGQLSAVDNACRHQNGPLSEGKIVDGCITCPWHGYQYLPESGTSPPPFEEKISTYNLRIVESTVWVNPTPNSPGTSVVPCNISNNQNE